MKKRWPGYAVVLILAITALALDRWEQRAGRPLAVSLSTIPSEIDGWVAASDGAFSKQVVEKLGATEYLDRVYVRDGRMIELLVAYYGAQRPGTAMHSPKNCLPGAGWEIWDYETLKLATGDRLAPVNRMAIQNHSERRQVLYWYQSRTAIVANEYAGKLLLVYASLRNGDPASSLVRITLPDVPGATEQGMRFASQVIPAVQACIGRPH
jgi:EpsI family protein